MSGTPQSDDKSRKKVTIMVVGLIVVVLVNVSFAYVLTKHDPPADVLREWVERMNKGDPHGSADLTIYAKMGSYDRQVTYLNSIIVTQGPDKIILNTFREIPRDQLPAEEWFSGLGDSLQWLYANYGIVVEDYRGVYSNITFSDNEGKRIFSVASYPAFLIESYWYLAYGLGAAPDISPLFPGRR